ncbi:MAG: acyl--CoA ligase [Campylobacteraceae bacterium]|nr:acyl--CoA ligase [Campylobacteraceae bacterium]
MNELVCIQDYIKDVPKSRIAFSSSSEKITYQNIFDIYESNKEKIKVLKNKCVIINAVENDDFAVLLTLLDGNVKKIVFIPKDINKETLNKFIEDTNASYTVSLDNQNIVINKLNSVDKDFLEIQETKWILATSGTTNIPKLVEHTFLTLSKSSQKVIQNDLSYIWALTFDIYRFSGIQVFLQSILSGCTLVIPTNNLTISETIDLYITNKCNTISATPSFYRKALMSKSFFNINLTTITLGGEISDQSIINSLSKKFPVAKIRHIYASTEVGVGFCVSDKKEGFPLSYIENGINNSFLKIDDNGILWIKPQESNQHYINSNKMYDKDGYIETGDLVKVINDRVFFKGRNSSTINVGGNKVQAEEIEFFLLSLSYIQEAYVFAKKSPIMGSIVYAHVVLNNKDKDKTDIKKKIFEFCNKNLEKFKIPAIIKIVDSLELTQNGKIKRN